MEETKKELANSISDAIKSMASKLAQMKRVSASALGVSSEEFDAVWERQWKLAQKRFKDKSLFEVMLMGLGEIMAEGHTDILDDLRIGDDKPCM